MLLFLILVPSCSSSVVEGPADPDAPELPEPVIDPFFVKSSFHLPSEGTPNNNGPIGPFCCTGVSAVLEAKAGYTAGYAYFFGAHGQAYNVGDTAIVPDIAIKIAGLADAYDPSSELVEGEIAWLADEMKIGAVKSVQAGELIFTSVIEDADIQPGPSGNYVDIGTLAVRIDVSVAP